jgi:hypothetical protein
MELLSAKSAKPVARKIVITVLGKVEDYQLSKHFDQENTLICWR